MTLHVIGNVCLDTTFRLARFPKPGETLNALSTCEGLGGKGANQAAAAARSGAAVRFIAAIGDDETADRISMCVREAGLDPSGLRHRTGQSDRSSIILDASGENLIVSAVPQAGTFDPLAGGVTLGIVEGDTLLMQGNLPAEATAACLALARASGATTILNASPLGEEGFLHGDVDVLIVNAGEAWHLSGHEAPENAVRALLALGPRAVLLTIGPGGAIVAERGEDRLRHILAPEVRAVDTSGAGDVFCGVVAGLVALGLDIAAAARIAVAASAIAVTRPGTLASCPSAEEILALRLSRIGTAS